MLDEGRVTAKIYKGFIKGKYHLFTLAYYMEGQFKKENFGSLNDAIARGKQVTASLEFLRVTHGDVAEIERQRVRQQLEEYCGMDTGGMLWILESLRQSVA